MRRRRLVASALVAWSAAWMACSSFDSAAPPADGGDGSAGEDGSTTTVDATSDVGGDTLFDAALDAPPDGACTAFFCDGFERASGVANGWNAIASPKGAELSLSQNHPNSGTRSLKLRLVADAGAPGSARTASLIKDLPAAVTRAALDFWIFYDEAPSTDTTVASITLQTLDGNVFVLLRDNGAFAFAEQYVPDGAAQHVTTPGTNVGVINSGAMRHVTLDVGQTLVDGEPGVRLTVDGAMKEAKLVNPSPRPNKVNVGSTFSAGGARNEDVFFYDDVAITTTTN